MLNKTDRKYENKWLSSLVREWMDKEDNNQITSLISELVGFFCFRVKMLAHHTEQKEIEPDDIAQILGETLGHYFNDAKIAQCPICYAENAVSAFYEGLTNSIEVTSDHIDHHKHGEQQ